MTVPVQMGLFVDHCDDVLPGDSLESRWNKLDSVIVGQRLVVSFSGGRTSAVMAKQLVDRYSDLADIAIVFANTGCEDHRTLDFVRDCESAFGWNVTWLEAVVDSKHGVGVRHKVVNYETASRSGEPFEAAVAKYGIFNSTNPSCTGRLKEDPIKSYLQSVGYVFGKGVNHYTAIGIRADEADRISTKRKARKFVYPLVSLGKLRETSHWKSGNGVLI